MIVQRKNVALRQEPQLAENKTAHLTALTRKDLVQEAGSGDDKGRSAHGEVCPIRRHVSGFDGVDTGAVESRVCEKQRLSWVCVIGRPESPDVTPVGKEREGRMGL
jgi:hypothetical protein